MLTLLSDRFAPITSAIGFLELPVDTVTEGLCTWRRQLHGSVHTSILSQRFPEVLHRLEPLTGRVRPRELLVQTADNWTAYFDCGILGGDPVSAIGYLSHTLLCQGVAIRSEPHTIGTKFEDPGRYGSVQFELFGPLQTDFINYVRTVSVSNDGGRWRFDAAGTVQDFERVEAYSARRIRDRFTSSMLADYCQALGIRPFDPEFYRGPAVLVESPVHVPVGGAVMGLLEAQAWLGIVPGVPDHLPG